MLGRFDFGKSPRKSLAVTAPFGAGTTASDVLTVNVIELVTTLSRQVRDEGSAARYLQCKNPSRT